MVAPRVLVVDDEPGVAAEVGMRLVGHGFEVAAVASSAREAIDLAEQTRPHLVLMDVVLGGGMERIETAEGIRRRRSIPRIFTVCQQGQTTLRPFRQGQAIRYLR